MPTSIDIFKRRLSLNGVFQKFFLSKKDLNLNLLDLNGNVISVDSVSSENVTLKELKGTTAPLMSTGQTTVYATGGDADVSYGRAFFTLDDPIDKMTNYVLSGGNWLSNTNRFTDTTGAQTYANDIVVDWSTYNAKTGEVLMYDRSLSLSAADTWLNQQQNASAHTQGGFSDWRLVNINESINITNNEQTQSGSRRLDYAPFNSSVGLFWTSSSVDQDNAIAWGGVTDLLTSRLKSVQTSAFLVRTGNISEL